MYDVLSELVVDRVKSVYAVPDTAQSTVLIRKSKSHDNDVSVVLNTQHLSTDVQSHQRSVMTVCCHLLTSNMCLLVLMIKQFIILFTC